MDTTLIRKYNIPSRGTPATPLFPVDECCSQQHNGSPAAAVFHGKQWEGRYQPLYSPALESLCTFCACNKRITRQHSVELPYIEALLKEWDGYVHLFPEKPLIREIHWWGNAHFFSPSNLEKLRPVFIATQYPSRKNIQL